jgi:hypothetical protein
MKYALIIGNNKYDDQKLAQLKTPAADSQALAKILDDKTIGSFDEVTPLINQTETRVRRAISTFLTNKKPDDLVLLYFSGHGILDDRGRLYLALKDTQVNLLKATSISSSFVADEMDSCRSKRQILILDCCHSGAFARGTKGEQKAITETTFEGSGFGRVVLTASDSTQYALEGDQIIKQTELSLFTHFLLEGLKTGEADVNNDGLIALDEWYDYTYNRVVSETPRQVPHKWSYNQQGDLVIAKNPFVKKKVVELPSELLQALESSFVGIRESAVNELGKYLYLSDPEWVDLAIASLEKMKQDDSRRISLLAERLLLEFQQTRVPSPKVKSSIPSLQIEPERASGSSESSMPSPKLTAEIGPATRKSLPEAEKVSKSIGTSLASQKLLFKASFWFKWIGISVLGLIFLSIIFDYDGTIISSGSYPFPGSYVVLILFSIVAGSLSFVQWFIFRDRLQDWWITANAATAIVLGLFHRSLYYADVGWEHVHLRIPLVVWLISNFVLGPILMQRTQKKSSDFSSPVASKPTTKLAETGTRQNIFFISLSLSLILFFLVIFSTVFSLTSAQDIFTILLGIANILVSLAFLARKEIPRNFGFISLAFSSFLYGIFIEINYSIPDFSLSLFSIPAFISLSSGLFFITQAETRKDFKFIALSGFLISVGVAQIAQDISAIYNSFSIISALFALVAAIFFFRGK